MNKLKLLSILNLKKVGQSWEFFIERENIQTELTKSALYVGESPQEIKYRLTHDIKTRPVCKCGNFLEFKSKYKQFCSKKCSSKYVVKGTSQTFKKVYWQKYVIKN